MIIISIQNWLLRLFIYNSLIQIFHIFQRLTTYDLCSRLTMMVLRKLTFLIMWKSLMVLVINIKEWSSLWIILLMSRFIRCLLVIFYEFSNFWLIQLDIQIHTIIIDWLTYLIEFISIKVLCSLRNPMCLNVLFNLPWINSFEVLVLIWSTDTMAFWWSNLLTIRW